MTKPKMGDIWRYPYLWKREADAGEEGGRKPRPTALAAVVPATKKPTLLYLLPITGTEPTKGQDALEIPVTEIHRAGLSEHKRLWIIFDEYNRDELEASFYFEPNAGVGCFSKAFLKVMSGRFAQALGEQRASIVNRKD
jgi:hypothetical protein